MKKEDLLRLKDVMALADEKAEEARAEYPNDDGGYNLDCVAIEMKGVRKSAIDEAGLSGYLAPTNSRHPRRLYLTSPSSGQANLRTEMAEIKAKFIKEAGYNCYVHYQND